MPTRPVGETKASYTRGSLSPFFKVGVLSLCVKQRFLLIQVLQTLSEAEQVCAELQHSVSGLDTRLAELLHWETEARELYQVLRAAQRQQRGQNPQAKARQHLK